MLICCTSDFLAFLLLLQGWDKVVVSNMCPRLSTIVHDCPKNDRKIRFRIGHSYFGKGVTNHQKSIIQWDLKKRVNVVGRPLSPNAILLSTVASHATERCKELQSTWGRCSWWSSTIHRWKWPAMTESFASASSVPTAARNSRHISRLPCSVHQPVRRGIESHRRSLTGQQWWLLSL